MQRELARKILQLVSGISQTDGELHPDEGALLRRVKTRLGLPAHGGSPIVPTLNSEDAAREMSALPEEAKQEALELLIDAAVVDGKVVPAERRYLEVVATALGTDAAQLERRIERRLRQL